MTPHIFLNVTILLTLSAYNYLQTKIQITSLAMPKRQPFTKKSRKTYRLNNCNSVFRNEKAWKEHVLQSDACKSSHYPCIHCNKHYVEYEEGHLLQHYNQSIFGCKNLAKSHKATYRYLPILYKNNRTDDDNCSQSSASDTDMVAFEPDNTDTKFPSTDNNDKEPVFSSGNMDFSLYVPFLLFLSYDIFFHLTVKTGLHNPLLNFTFQFQRRFYHRTTTYISP